MAVGLLLGLVATNTGSYPVARVLLFGLSMFVSYFGIKAAFVLLDYAFQRADSR